MLMAADIAPDPMARGRALQQQAGEHNRDKPLPALGSIEGTVIDKSTNLALAYCNIVFVASGMGTMTETDGSFSIHNIPPGPYVVKAAFMGYIIDTICRVEVEVGKTTYLSFELESAEPDTTPIIIDDSDRDSPLRCEIHGFQLVQAKAHIVGKLIVHDEAYEKVHLAQFPHGEIEIYDECLSQSLDSMLVFRCPACVKVRERWLGNRKERTELIRYRVKPYDRPFELEKKK